MNIIDNIQHRQKLADDLGVSPEDVKFVCAWVDDVTGERCPNMASVRPKFLVPYRVSKFGKPLQWMEVEIPALTVCPEHRRQHAQDYVGEEGLKQLKALAVHAGFHPDRRAFVQVENNPFTPDEPTFTIVPPEEI